MPPEIRIHKNFVNAAKAIIERKTYNGHALETDNEFDVNEDRIGGNIHVKIEAVKQNIQRRIANGETIGENQFGNNEELWHIVKRDLMPILDTLEPICPNCDATGMKLWYTARATERGSAYASIENETDDHETDETNTDGDYEYTCMECDGDINPGSIQYFIPGDAYIELCAFLEEVLNMPNVVTEAERQTNRTVGDMWVPPWQTTRPKQTHKQTETFPVGRQIQEDIAAHGPNGPQMHINTQGTQVSGPEDFAFRNNGRSWICKHCEQMNSGENKKCGNKSCQKDKFAPVKEIKLTT